MFYVDEMAAVLADLAPTCLHLLVGENTDSGKPTQKAHFEGISAFTLEQESLFDVITECRVVPPPPPPPPTHPAGLIGPKRRRPAGSSCMTTGDRFGHALALMTPHRLAIPIIPGITIHSGYCFGFVHYNQLVSMSELLNSC